MLRDAMSFSSRPDVFDLLVLESTYGDRNHENRADQQTLCDWVKSMPEPPE